MCIKDVDTVLENPFNLQSNFFLCKMHIRNVFTIFFFMRLSVEKSILFFFF